MKVEISKDGILIFIPDSALEEYGINTWLDKNIIQMMNAASVEKATFATYSLVIPAHLLSVERY